MFCPNCGSAGTPGGRYCGQCGRPAIDVPEASGGPPSPLSDRGRAERGELPPSTYIVLVALGAAAIGLVMASLTGVVRARLDPTAGASSTAAPHAVADTRTAPNLLVRDTVRPPASARPGDR